jgi:hypothetical protein
VSLRPLVAEEARNPGYVVREFVGAVTAEAPGAVAAQLQAFYYRITVDILTSSHGALVAVLSPHAEVPGFLTTPRTGRAPGGAGPRPRAPPRAER